VAVGRRREHNHAVTIPRGAAAGARFADNRHHVAVESDKRFIRFCAKKPTTGHARPERTAPPSVPASGRDVSEIEWTQPQLPQSFSLTRP
jgi:hypothetical protein